MKKLIGDAIILVAGSVLLCGAVVAFGILCIGAFFILIVTKLMPGSDAQSVSLDHT